MGALSEPLPFPEFPPTIQSRALAAFLRLLRDDAHIARRYALIDEYETRDLLIDLETFTLPALALSVDAFDMEREGGNRMGRDTTVISMWVLDEPTSTGSGSQEGLQLRFIGYVRTRLESTMGVLRDEDGPITEALLNVQRIPRASLFRNRTGNLIAIGKEVRFAFESKTKVTTNEFDE